MYIRDLQLTLNVYISPLSSHYRFQAMKILNQNCMQMYRLIILCFLFTLTAAASAAAAANDDDPNHISINCGGAAPATALTGRQWLLDAAPEGSSTTATVKGELITVVDPVPYKTARISRSQFSYSFQMSPGQKLIRLHFNPVPYHGFESFNDLFTVEAGPFTLLANFSASITASALAVNTFIKEFCIVLQENQPLNIVFSPETSFHYKYNYAFINGIEIISVPSTISYCHGGDSGVRVLGKNYVIHLENTTALEVVHRQDIKWGSLSSDNDGDGMFGLWANKAYNRSWKVSVDVGFRYLVRLHLCEVGLKMDFRLLVNNMIALTSADMPKQRGDQTNLWYNNYMVMVEGHKREGKRLITICLHSPHEFLNRRGPLEGFEVLKLSNPDLSLASPNPLPPRVDSPSQTILTRLQSLLGLKNVATVVFTTLCLVKITTLLLHKMWGPDFSKEENLPSARARRLCRHFTLAEIRSATQNFHVEFLLGKGGFGKVYKGLLDNGRDVVAIKRSKPDSNQGEQQFWTEVEMLSELRHVNLVSLIGYCMEQQEMILVYEYMPRGTLADHLYKLSRKSNPFYPLSWKQRLKICIGAGRALDYLHTGHGIIHRDVKASNILLDEKFVAKVSDFGLAKTGSGSDSQSQDSTNFKGTIGYIDPNYFRTRKITKNSDTYSFGVVLLEVLCGRPAVEPWEDMHGLTTWAIDNIRKGQVDHIVAPSLRGEILVDSLKTFVKVAERCLHEEPKKRPAMTHIVIELELAFQQQEKAESLPLKEHMNFMSPNEKINVANLRIFTFSELKVATRNFRSDSVLGDGAFGTVYKGLLHEKLYSKAGSGTLIAVKKLDSKSKQGFQEWQSEVNFLGRLSHPNLVKLLGYGWEGKTLFLVYEFMPKGSIDNHLFGRGASVQPLPWGIRLKILVGAAHGLAFLHDTNVIHRDFKISNILLDGSYQAKLSDFGLAKMGPADSRSHVTATHVLGTPGYAAPEYVATGHLYVKSDVYGFGVVLVEMLTGLRPYDAKRPSGQHNLTDWIKPHLSERRKLEKIIDARLEGRYPCKSAVQIAQLALHCLENDPKNRPSMQEVVETLELVVSADERPQECRVHFSHQVVNQQGEQPLQNLSPLHPLQEATPTT